jgi:hypothetical protein
MAAENASNCCFVNPISGNALDSADFKNATCLFIYKISYECFLCTYEKGERGGEGRERDREKNLAKICF